MSENINIIETSEYDPNKVYATIVKRDDGFHVIDEDGTEGPVCKYCDADDKTIVLTKNASNRQWFNRARADKLIEEVGHVDLYYKPTRKIGQGVTRNTMPNAKLISYLSEEDQAEYKAIIDRAIAAREADRKKPLTAEEKLQAKIAKLQAQIAKLQESESETAEAEA